MKLKASKVKDRSESGWIWRCGMNVSMRRGAGKGGSGSGLSFWMVCCQYGMPALTHCTQDGRLRFRIRHAALWCQCEDAVIGLVRARSGLGRILGVQCLT